MLGGLFLLPALIALFKPKFITRAAAAKNASLVNDTRPVDVQP